MSIKGRDLTAFRIAFKEGKQSVTKHYILKHAERCEEVQNKVVKAVKGEVGRAHR